MPSCRQKKAAPFRFRRGGENSISAASFFLSKPEPFHWVPVWLTNGAVAKGDWGSFFEPILFFLLLRKKRTVSIFQEKKASKVTTVVLNLTQIISVISCPLHHSLPPERSLRSAHRGVRRSQLHSTSAEAAKAPYPLAPSSFPNCDRCAGSQFGVIWGGQMHRGTELLHDGGTGWSPGFESSLSFLHRARRFFSFSIKRKKRMGRKAGGQGRPPLHSDFAAL